MEKMIIGEVTCSELKTTLETLNKLKEFTAGLYEECEHYRFEGFDIEAVLKMHNEVVSSIDNCILTVNKLVDSHQYGLRESFKDMLK